MQDAIQNQHQRKAEIESYQLLLIEIENWLKSTANITVVENIEQINDDESNALAKLARLQAATKQLKEKEKKLSAIKAKCDNLSEFSDVNPLAGVLSNQLTLTIVILREQLTLSQRQIQILERYLQQLREQPSPLLSQADTLGPSPMPEEEMVPCQLAVETQTSDHMPVALHVEQQTSFPLNGKVTIETLDTSVQTSKEKKPTENIHVTQTFSEGHETIQIESTPNAAVNVAEDVFVDAKYQQPGDPKKTTELVLRNVPAESFETTFVEPDETTTEVFVDADGTKRIVVRKLTRTRHDVVQHHQQQQFTISSSLVGANAVPVTQSVTQVNLENQMRTATVANADGSQTGTRTQSRRTVAAGDAPDNLVIQEVFETAPQIEGCVTLASQPIQFSTEPSVEQSSVETVVHHVTRRIIRRTRKIIRRVVIIDGEEHVTEEVVEEPEEIEVTEEDSPNVNVNIVRTINGRSLQASNEPIVHLAPDDVVQTVEIVPLQHEQGKHDARDEKQVIEESAQVLEFEPSTAPTVELNALNASAPQVTVTIVDVTIDDNIPAKTTVSEIVVVAEPTPKESEKQISEESSPKVEEKKEVIEVCEAAPQRPQIEKMVEDDAKHSVITVTKIDLVSTTSTPIETPAKTPSDDEKITIEIDEIVPSQRTLSDSEKGPSEVESVTEVKEIVQTIEPTREPEIVPETVKQIVDEVQNIVEIWPPVDVTTTPTTTVAHASPDHSETIEHVPQQPSDTIASQDIWPIDERTGTPFQIETYQFESASSPIVNVESEEIKSPDVPVPSTPIVESIVVTVAETTETVETLKQPTIVENVEIVQVATPELIEATESIEMLPQSTTTELDDAALKPLPTIDVRRATQMFIENELNVSDATTRTVKVSLPSTKSQSPGSVTVTMKVEPTDGEPSPPKLNVNIVEEGMVEQPPNSNDSKRKRKKNKKKKTPTPPVSIDPSVVESVELHVAEEEEEDEKTISEQMEMPEIETAPSAAAVEPDVMEVKVVSETVISPDETYASIASDQVDASTGAIVKVVEHSVLSSTSESPKPIATELIVTKDVLEERAVDDALVQTSPEPIREEMSIVSAPVEKATVETRSMQTSPDVEPAHASQQTSPEPRVEQIEQQNQTEEHETTEIEVQTSPVPLQVVEIAPPPEVIVTSEEVQTDAVPTTEIIEVSVQTTQITVTEKDAQTSPQHDTKPITVEEIVVDAQDIVPHIAEKLVAEIVREIPIQIANATEGTNTEQITTIDSLTQTIDETPKSGEQPTVAVAPTPAAAPVPEKKTKKPKTKTDAQQPFEISVETSITIAEDAPDALPDVEVTIDDGKQRPSDGKKKKNSRKGKDKKPVDQMPTAAAIDSSAKFLEQERYTQSTDAGPHHVEVEISTKTSQEQPRVKKPTLVQLDITRTTVYDTLNVGAERQPLHDEAETRVTVKKTIAKPQVTSAVKIEEVLSPTEEIDVPLTPGNDHVAHYDQQRDADTIWEAKLMASRPITQEFIPSESYQLLSTTATATAIAHRPQAVVAQWQDANAAITDRIRNSNVRKAPLSNVLHLATLSECVTGIPLEQRIETVDANIDNLQRAIESRQTVVIQKTVITVIETISTWLETVEYRVYLSRQNSGDGPSDEANQKLEDLCSELETIDSNVAKLAVNLDRASDLIEPAERQRMHLCFTNLREQVQAVETVTRENSEQAKKDMERWNAYLFVVETIWQRLKRTRDELQQTLAEDETPLTTEQQVLRLDDLDRENRDQLAQIAQAMNTARGLTRDFPGKQLPVDIHAAYENARNLENAIVIERNRLLQLQSLAQEYDQTLNEFAQIMVMAEAMMQQPINVTSLEQLQQEIQKHRKFFITLSHCRQILESLEENVDAESRARNANLHRSLLERATQVLEKATERVQRITLAASRWTVLEKGMRDECQWLLVAQQRVPDLSEVTSADYERYITLYQSLSTDIAYHHAKILQLVGTANQLQELVQAPSICEENNDELNALLRLRDEVNQYLRRLRTFRESWTTYETLTDRLELWIKEAERELAAIEIPSDLRTQPIDRMRQFWEIKIHYEVNNSIRKDISDNLETSIDILPIADEVLQRQFHDQLEDRWFNVSHRIDSIQAAIVSSLSDQEIPTNDKLSMLHHELEEIQANIGSVKSVIKNEDELNVYIERMQVLNSRIGIICNELGRLGMLPATEPERVGELFALAHSISISVGEELENATILKDRLGAIQDGIRRVQQTQAENAAVLDQCESTGKLGSEQIELAAVECQHIADELVVQWEAIMRLRQLLHALPMRLRVSVSPVKLERDLSHLQDEHAVLESRCANILTVLKQRLILWRRFERQLEIVQQSTHETDYMVELLKVNGQVDYERLRKATERLEVCVLFYSFLFRQKRATSINLVNYHSQLAFEEQI